ncbi:unnamed protein product, partial [Fusarium graminearum]
MYPLSTRPGCEDSVEGFEGRDSGDHDASRASLKKWGRMNPYAYQDHRDVLWYVILKTRRYLIRKSFIVEVKATHRVRTLLWLGYHVAMRKVMKFASAVSGIIDTRPAFSHRPLKHVARLSRSKAKKGVHSEHKYLKYSVLWCQKSSVRRFSLPSAIAILKLEGQSSTFGVSPAASHVDVTRVHGRAGRRDNALANSSCFHTLVRRYCSPFSNQFTGEAHTHSHTHTLDVRDK